MLNCPCHLYGSIPSDAQLSPLSFGIFKSYVDRKNNFQSVYAICLSKKEDAPCYARPIHGKGALALEQFSTRAILSHTMTELSLLCIFVIGNSRSLRIP